MSDPAKDALDKVEALAGWTTSEHITAMCSIVHAELDRLRAENAKLRKRVAELEAMSLDDAATMGELRRRT